MSVKTRMIFPPRKLEWLKSKLAYNNAAYNFIIGDETGFKVELQGDYRGNIDDVISWIQEMIRETDWPQNNKIKSFDLEDVIFDHYLADEIAEAKMYPAPDFAELPTVTIYVPSYNQIIQVSEGDGSNLDSVDKENGCIDYIYYKQYDLDDITEEVDGGQIDTKEYVRDMYKSLVEAIPQVLEFVYDNVHEPYVVLDTNTPALESEQNVCDTNPFGDNRFGG